MRSSILNPRSSTILLIAALLVIPAIVQGQTKLRASFAGTTGYHLPMWVQKQEGLDKKYGLDMEILLIAGGSRIIQTLLSGELLLTHSGAATVARAGIAGADLTMIATVMNQVNWRIVARKEIRDVKDLLGKKIAIASRGGSSELGLQLAFKKWNLDFNRVTLLSLGPSPTRMAALREGVVDATVFAYPELIMATKEGFPTIADLRPFADLTDTSVVVTRTALEKQRPLLKRFLQGYVEAIQRIKRNPESAYRALARYTGVSDRAALEESRKFYADDDLHVIHEEILPEAPEEVARIVHKYEGQAGWHLVTRLMDPNMGASPSSAKQRELTWQNEFDSCGLRCDLASDSDVGRSRINTYLDIDTHTNRPRLTVSPDCPVMVKQMKRYVWGEYKMDGDHDVKQKPRAKEDDGPTCLKYLLNSDPRFADLRMPQRVVSRMGLR